MVLRVAIYKKSRSIFFFTFHSNFIFLLFKINHCNNLLLLNFSRNDGMICSCYTLELLLLDLNKKKNERRSHFAVLSVPQHCL